MTAMLGDEDVTNELLNRRCRKLVKSILKIELKSAKAKEYLCHGVAHRVGVLGRCVENIYC